MAERWETLRVEEGEMRAFVAQPDEAGPYPGVVLAQHGSGVDDFMQEMTRRLAKEGYVCIAPDLYHRQDPSLGTDYMARIGQLRDADVIMDMNAAVSYLKRQKAARGDRIGITGFCMGGRVTYLLAASNPVFKAAAVFYGGNIMRPWGEGPAPFDLTAGIRCPVLGLFGEEDANPSPEDVRRIDRELTRYGRAHEFHSYAGAGHAFMTQGRPSYRATAARDAWANTLDWFKKHLLGPRTDIA